MVPQFLNILQLYHAIHGDPKQSVRRKRKKGGEEKKKKKKKGNREKKRKREKEGVSIKSKQLRRQTCTPHHARASNETRERRKTRTKYIIKQKNFKKNFKLQKKTSKKLTT